MTALLGAVLEYLDILIQLQATSVREMFLLIGFASENHPIILDSDSFSYLLSPKLFQHILLVPSAVLNKASLLSAACNLLE